MDLDTRIAQFENMCREDPDNDMAHFSLGNAYAQAGRHADAAASYMRCIEVNPAMSKAYQLAGEQLVEAGKTDPARTEEAAELLATGYTSAASRGDRMPMLAMGKLLEQIGRPVPEVEVEDAGGDNGNGDFVCQRTGRNGHQLPRPPFKGPVGQWIYENISKETWDAWIGQGTKVINELRLDLSQDKDAEAYDQHMYEFLGLDEGTLAELRGAKA
ncbi:MAG: Fe(2+)-trafficking protein [Planctomycetota bacterium]